MVSGGGEVGRKSKELDSNRIWKLKGDRPRGKDVIVSAANSSNPLVDQYHTKNFCQGDALCVLDSASNSHSLRSDEEFETRMPGPGKSVLIMPGPRKRLTKLT